MYFKIDYDKVSDVGFYLKNKSDELDGLYSDILGICDEIENNYKSEDSTVYLSRFRYNVEKLMKENQDLKKGSDVLRKIYSLYSNQEADWAQSILDSELDKGGRE